MKIATALSVVLLSLLAAIAGPPDAQAAVALIYHRFDDARYPSTNVSLATFHSQLEWLAANGFEAWPASRLVAHMQAGDELPDRVVVITIDDGYRSLLGAVALLEQFRFPFSVFVSTGDVDRRIPDLLGWNELRALCGRGGEVLNHGIDHESLLARPGEADAARRQRVTAQVTGAQARLAAELPAGCHGRIFSYPYGEYDGLAEETLAGLAYAVFGQHSGAIAGWNSLQALPRFPVNQQFADSPQMTTKLLSLPFPDVLEPADPVVSENPPLLRLRRFPSIDRVHCFDGSGRPLERFIGHETYGYTAAAPLAAGRNRYNCTYPGTDGQRYHWLSHFWFVP